LGNALILHDINHYSATFIHLWPAWTTLAIRLNLPSVMETYPGHFAGFSRLDSSAQFTGLHLFFLGARFYLAWWVVFTLWMLARGRFQNPAGTGRDTVYLDLMRTTPAMRAMCGVRKSRLEDDAAKIGPVIKYMLLHAVAIHAALAFGAFCLTFPPEMFHAPFCVFILGVAVFNGARRYEYYLTEKETKALKALIKEQFPEHAPPDTASRGSSAASSFKAEAGWTMNDQGNASELAEDTKKRR